MPNRQLRQRLLASLLSIMPLSLAALETLEIKLDRVTREHIFDARLEAVNETTISAQISGQITEILFDIDDYVEKGEVIVRFRDRDQRAAVSAAEARQSEAQATFNRMRDLLAKGTVSRAEFERAEATLKEARAALERAQEQLAHTQVLAPYSGIVIKRHVQLGEVANPGQPLMSGVSLEELRAVVAIPQRHIDTIRRGAAARILLPDSDGEVAAARVTISPYADPQTHSFMVRVDLPRGEYGLYPGMLTKVGFITGSEDRLVVPQSAVAQRSEVNGVYVVGRDGKLIFRHVRLGRTTANGMVTILAGLEAGEQIATDPIAAVAELKRQRSHGSE
jgi:RND family efflux transporter MFP subunit